MELRHLAAFVAVAEEGGFTRAADRLNVVQSAVSAGVRTLGTQHRKHPDIVAVSDAILRDDLVIGCVQEDP